MKALLLLTAVLAAPLLAHADPLVRPDVMKAVQAHRDGRLDEALALIKGCFDQIAAGDSGAQLSYFITMFEWPRLAMDYAPARQALIAERDVQAGKLLAGDANFAGEGYTAISRFQLIAEMNRFLQDERSTYRVFTRLLDDFPDLARREARTALPAIVEAGDYRLALRYLDENPLRNLDELNHASRELPLYPPPSEPPEVASQLQNFVNDVTLRTKTLKGLGKAGEAEQLRNAALAGIELAEVRALAEQEFSKPGSIYRTLAEHQATEPPPRWRACLKMPPARQTSISIKPGSG